METIPDGPIFQEGARIYNGDEFRRDEMWRAYIEASDIVQGNRYTWAKARYVPDERGAVTALVTYRGPNAPERPKVLPVGTRVRCRKDECDKFGVTRFDGVGTIIRWDANGLAPAVVSWGDGKDAWCPYRADELELLSLPDHATDAAPKPSEPLCRRLTGYDGDDRPDDPDVGGGTGQCTQRDTAGKRQSIERGINWSYGHCVADLRDYTPPAVLARRKPEPVRVRVDNGWHDPD